MRRDWFLILLVLSTLLLAARRGEMTAKAASLQRTPTPLDSVKLSFPEIRYRLLERFGSIFHCSGVPVERFTFSDIQKDDETLRAIARHLGFEQATELSPEQKNSIYRQYSQLAAIRLEHAQEQYHFHLGVRDKAGDFWIDGSIDSNGSIAILSKEHTVFNCPKCLAANTRISTPSGPMLVKDLQPGMPVWTLDVNRRRVVTTILKASASPVPVGHRVVHLVLDDGRELWVSPGHPTVDGHTIGELKQKAIYDGAMVSHVEVVAYGKTMTYDLLPAGDTGFYWANGILLASTLQ